MGNMGNPYLTIAWIKTAVAKRLNNPNDKIVSRFGGDPGDLAYIMSRRYGADITTARAISKRIAEDYDKKCKQLLTRGFTSWNYIAYKTRKGEVRIPPA